MMETVLRTAQTAGFTRVGPLALATLVFYPEVRAMCAADRCRSFGRSWTCPPAVPALETVRQLVAQYKEGILVQSATPLADSFDVMGMRRGMRTHHARLRAMAAALREQGVQPLVMGAGACTRCAVCAYPQKPCRNPGEAFVSMEAYGLLVAEVCEANGLPYVGDANSVTYTSCALF